MIRELGSAFRRTQDTLLQDAVGAISLVVILIAALHLPTLL